MFRVKHFSTKRSITKHRKHIFPCRDNLLWSCARACLRHFSAQNVKNNFEKNKITITKSHFQTIEKRNSISNRSPTAVSCNKHARATRFNQSRVQIRQQSLHIYAKKKIGRALVYGKIEVDKLFRKPFCTKTNHLAVQFDGE